MVASSYPAVTSSISAAITNQGREIIAKSVLGLLSYKLLGFKVGRLGWHDAVLPANRIPTNADPVNPAATDLLDPIFPVIGYTPFVTIETPFPNVVAPVCRLNSNEATYGLGEIGIWADILSSTDAGFPAGTPVMFAMAHFPLKCKTDRDNFIFRVIIAV